MKNNKSFTLYYLEQTLKSCTDKSALTLRMKGSNVNWKSSGAKELPCLAIYTASEKEPHSLIRVVGSLL